MAQIFGRYERFRGHLISAVPRHFVCAECKCSVTYHSLIDGDQQITCIRDISHQGLLDTATAIHETMTRAIQKREGDLQTLEELATDTIKAIRRDRTDKARQALWGE